MGYSVENNGRDNMSVLQAESERDRQSSASTEARNQMEGFNLQSIIGAAGEIFKLLSMIASG